MTCIDDGDDDLDRALLEAATENTAEDLEGLVRYWKLLRSQDRTARDRWAKRGVRWGHRWDGMATAELVLLADEAERVMSILDTYAEAHRRDRPVDEASAEAASVDPLASRPWAGRRADALLDLLEAGLAHVAADGEVDPERATIDVVTDYELLVGATDLPGAVGGVEPLPADAVRRLACDAGLVRIVVKGQSEVVDVGRKTRQWNRAQRRAIRFRHGGRCAFPGCPYRITQIHHTDPWGDGGATDLDLGVPLCWGHHHLVHDLGWTVEREPITGVVTFTSPDGRQTSGRPRTSIHLAA